MPRGGKRAGAGRKFGTVEADTIAKLEGRRILRALVMAEVEPMTAAQIAAAKGINYAVVRRSDGTFRRIESAEMFDAAVEAGDLITIHTNQPSTAAYTDLMNRALDKPVEPVELEHKGGIDIRWKGQK